MLTKNWVNTDVKISTVTLPVLSASTTDINGTGVDCRGYESVVLAAFVGLSGDTLSGSVKVEFEVEESDDNSTYTDCADAVLVNPATGAAGAVTGTNTGTFAVVDAAADDEQFYFTRYIGTKRYVRVVVNKTGTHTNGIPLATFAMRARPTALPVV